MPDHAQCRVCRAPLPAAFLDLGEMPLANAFPSSPAEFAAEARYPLAVTACESTPDPGTGQTSDKENPFLPEPANPEATRRLKALGAAWRGGAQAFGLPFGSGAPERLGWLRERCP